MDYIISYLSADDRLDGTETHLSHRVYPYAKKHIGTIKDELLQETLEYARKQRSAPSRVSVSKEFPIDEEGECLLQVRMLYPDVFLNARVMKVASEDVLQTAPFPRPAEHFRLRFYFDWNVIYRDVHYTESSFINVYENFLKGIDPDMIPNADV